MDRPVASPVLEDSAAEGVEPRDPAGDVSAAPGFLTEGSPRGVLETALTRLRAGEHAVLALVLETAGSTYAGAGDMVLFCNGSQVGWLSGGCLEPELARRAEQVSAAGRVDWIEVPPPDGIPSLKQAGYVISTNSYPHVWPWFYNMAAKMLSPLQVRAKRWQCLSFGGSVYLVLLIPFVNIVMMPAAIAGATLFWVRERG